MRVAVAAATAAILMALPALLRGTLVAYAPPRLLAASGLTALTGIAAGFLSLLAAVVTPEPLAPTDVARAVEVCALAVSRFLRHPVGHWPSMVAAGLLLAALGRLLVAVALTARDARRARPPRFELPGERREVLRAGGVPEGVRVLPTDEVAAYTTGVLRPRVVVTTGLLRSLGLRERQAVLAHERAHAERHHTLALFLCRAVDRAFGFVPGIRVAVGLVVTGLEATADEAAARGVRDPLVVVRALSQVAALGGGMPAPAMGGGELSYRLRRLSGEGACARSRLAAGAAGLLVAFLLAQGVAWSAGPLAVATEVRALGGYRSCELGTGVG